MNHWQLVLLDILVIVKYLAPLIGSLILFLLVTENVANSEHGESMRFTSFIIFLIAVALYVWGMS